MRGGVGMGVAALLQCKKYSWNMGKRKAYSSQTCKLLSPFKRNKTPNWNRVGPYQSSRTPALHAESPEFTPLATSAKGSQMIANVKPETLESCCQSEQSTWVNWINNQYKGVSYIHMQQFLGRLSIGFISLLLHCFPRACISFCLLSCCIFYLLWGLFFQTIFVLYS